MDLANRAPALGVGALAALGHVSLSAVAETAGVTRSALYHVWPSKKEFYDELLRYMFASEWSSPPSAPEPPADHRHEVDRTEATYDAVQAVLLADRAALLEIALVSHPKQSVPRELLAVRRRKRLARFAARINERLEPMSYQPTDGVTTGDLAAALTMPGQGLPITARLGGRRYLGFDSAAYRAPERAGRSLFGALEVAIGRRLSQPATAVTSISQPAHAPVRDEVATFAPTGRRKDYLEIGARLAREPHGENAGIAQALGYVTSENLARTLGISRRSLTNVWPDQASFRLDLLVHLLRRERDRVIEAVDACSEGAEQQDGIDLFLELGERIHTDAARYQADLSFTAFAPYFDDAQVTERLHHEHEAIVRRLNHSIEFLLWAAGRRPRPGVPPEQLSVALLVLCDGASRLLRTDPSLVRSDVTHNGRERSITALTVAAVLDALSEPVDVGPGVARYAALVS